MNTQRPSCCLHPPYGADTWYIFSPGNMEGGFYLKLNLHKMTTETRNQSTWNLDTMTPLEVVTAMNQEDAKVPQAIAPQLPRIAQAVEWAIEALESGGRMFLHGCRNQRPARCTGCGGMSPPTFGVSPDLIVGLIAGGNRLSSKQWRARKTAGSWVRRTFVPAISPAKTWWWESPPADVLPTSWVAWSWPGRKDAGP